MVNETVQKLESEMNQLIYDVYNVDKKDREIIEDFLK